MGFRPQSRPNFRSEIPLSQSSPTTKHIFEHPQAPVGSGVGSVVMAKAVTDCRGVTPIAA
jgi:hypothetical protein